MTSYTIILDPDPQEGGYTVTVPTLPGCVTQGETVDECLARAQEAIELYLEDLKAGGEPMPQERVHPQLLTVTIST